MSQKKLPFSGVSMAEAGPGAVMAMQIANRLASISGTPEISHVDGQGILVMAGGERICHRQGMYSLTPPQGGIEREFWSIEALAGYLIRCQRERNESGCMVCGKPRLMSKEGEGKWCEVCLATKRECARQARVHAQAAENHLAALQRVAIAAWPALAHLEGYLAERAKQHQELCHVAQLSHPHDGQEHPQLKESHEQWGRAEALRALLKELKQAQAGGQ